MSTTPPEPGKSDHESLLDQRVAEQSLGRSSRVWDVTRGDAWWTTVDIYAGYATETMVQPIRSALESMRIGVNYWQIANSRIADRLIARVPPSSPYIILAIHGDGESLTYNPPNLPNGPNFKVAYGIDELRTATCFQDRIVTSIGCASGKPEFVSAFLDAGVAAYIAPTASPFGHAAPAFLSLLFFCLTQNRGLADSIRAIQDFDYELSHWKLFERPRPASGLPG